MTEAADELELGTLERVYLTGLARQVRRLAQRGEIVKLQELVKREAEKRGEQPWDLTHQLAAIGFELGIAKPIEMRPAEDPLN